MEGAFAHIALRALFPHAEAVSCPTWDEVFAAVERLSLIHISTTAHRSFVRMERTEDGGVRFLPEVLAAGGRFSVYAVDQTGRMRVAAVSYTHLTPGPGRLTRSDRTPR